MADPVGPIKPNCDYPFDANFPIKCDVDYSRAYCCQPPPQSGDGFIQCEYQDEICLAGTPGNGQIMTFPLTNELSQPMLKTALGGTTMSTWVRIAFQQYCGDGEDPIATARTIITMGNKSQPCNDEQCKAVIKAFQYAWGTTNEGNRCRVTIMDQKGGEFQSWVQRLGISPESDSTPIRGKYRMKVQWGWYVTGGAPEDVCGQPAQPLGDPVNCDNEILPIQPPDPGFNSAFIICSPVLYFMTEMINVHWEQGKFMYELEGSDTLVRGQENMIQQIFGRDNQQMYFTKACELLGAISFPQFRIEFKAINAAGKIVPMEFSKADTNTTTRATQDDQIIKPPLVNAGKSDCKGYGPFGVFRPNTKPPLATIQDWITGQTIFAKDLTGKVPGGKVGITLNYDPTYKFSPTDDFQPTTTDPCAVCSGNLPQYGRLLMWANGIPYCQGNLTDTEINRRMRAVYVVNGGNCSPVISFTPTIRWHSWGAKPLAGNFNTANKGLESVAVAAIQGAVKTNCPIASSRGPYRAATVTATETYKHATIPSLLTQQAMFHYIMTNLGLGAIEADLKVQGDPASWLCTPIDGYTRTVGIIFINPFFLEEDPNSPVKGCPNWFAIDPDEDNPFDTSSINKLLTNKGWYIMGVEHQIKDGQYVTTLKLQLVAPGAELLQAKSIVKLGGWEGAIDKGTAVPYAGRFGCLTRTLIGNEGVSWGNQPGEHETCGLWVGGGTPCQDNYLVVPPSELPPN